MAFKKILFIPTSDNLDQPGGRALLTLAGPGSEIDVFEPVYNTDLQQHKRVDGERFELARDELVRTRVKRIGRLAEKLEDRGLKTSISAAWDHPVHEAIIRRALASKADLVITEPIEGRAGALSNGDWRLASKCPVPLLLVRRDGAGGYEKITAAVDPFHSHAKPAELDRSIIECAKEIQGLSRGEIQVVHCFAPITGFDPGPYTEQLPIDDAEKSLEANRRDVLNKLVKDSGLQTDTANLFMGRPNEVLRTMVEAGGVDLLVMGALSRGRIRDFVLGNTAQHMLYHTGVDILLVKPPGFWTAVVEQMPDELLTRPLYFPL